MLSWALTFAIVAIICAVLPGLGVISGLAANIAYVCFVLFLILFIVSLVTGRRPAV